MKYFHTVIVSTFILGSCNIFSPLDSDDTTERSQTYSEMKLIFTRLNEIWLYDLLTEELEKLIAVGEPVYTHESGSTLYRISADQAKWSPDGKEIVFIERVGFNGGHLKVHSLETGEQRFFQNRSGRGDAHPEWSADGKKIVFAKFVYDSEIFIVDSDGENETQLTDRPHYTDTFPTIHANGIDIVFGSLDDRTYEPIQIFHTTINGDTAVQLTFSDVHLLQPEINRVTAEMIYARKNEGNSYFNIWKVSDMNFEDPVQLTESDYRKGDATCLTTAN